AILALLAARTKSTKSFIFQGRSFTSMFQV
ncbi:MAG: hypothetical protein ACI84C_001394, partial [Flavobacteriales bacterium]